MKLIRGLNWALGILGVIIVIALVIVCLPWKNRGAKNASAADEKIPATAPAESQKYIQTAPDLPEQRALKDAAVGGSVLFGHYEQDNDGANGKEAIEWLVLDREGDSLLLLSLYGLDCQPYHNKTRFVYWSNCALRDWLTDSFLQEAFTEEEQEMILTTTVTADPNPAYNTPTGADVEDMVFLLSAEEADRYLQTKDERLCLPTAYARAQGAYVRQGFVACWWWLRTSGGYGDHAVSVGNLGDYYYVGLGIRAADCAVRPAIWVRTGE